MNTSKPIAGVSYNSKEFLLGKLKDWRDSGLIEWGAFIYHKKEGEEKKDHHHIFIVPARRLQTIKLEDDSQEPDPAHPDKPLKIVGLSSSKFTDWFLYSLHDKAYLLEKGLERSYHYSLEDFITTDVDRFNIMIAEIGEERQGRIEYRIIQMINNGMSWPEMISSGLIPIRYIYPAKIIYDSLHGFDVMDHSKNKME